LSSATKKKCFIKWTPDGDGGPDGESFTGTFWLPETFKDGVGGIFAGAIIGRWPTEVKLDWKTQKVLFDQVLFIKPTYLT
jgi:hypothetical protein